MIKHLLAILLLLPLSLPGQEQKISAVANSPVHEAFINRISESVVLDSAPKPPPPSINERIPPRTDTLTQWIPGYWTWNQERNDYYWTSGIWRRPPPDHTWIVGLWKEYDRSWVWIPGFWSAVDERALDYIDTPPPEPETENIPPSPGEDNFWVSGYWEYLPQQRQYSWVEGRWEKFDPNWVLVPSQYVWREKGYVFVPAFWDWKLEDRGTVYSPVEIPPAERQTLVYEPMIAIEPTVLVERLFAYYPDYAWFYHHHYHYHPEFWSGFCCTPPWWWWNTWWNFSWYDQWSLWWWYSHPGYPNPYWIDDQIAQILPRPTDAFYSIVKNTSPPINLTPRGPVNPYILRDRIFEERRRRIPVAPAERPAFNQLVRSVERGERGPREVLSPRGKVPGKMQLAPPPPRIKREVPREAPSREKRRPLEIPRKPQGPTRVVPGKGVPLHVQPSRPPEKGAPQRMTPPAITPPSAPGVPLRPRPQEPGRPPEREQRVIPSEIQEKPPASTRPWPPSRPQQPPVQPAPPQAVPKAPAEPSVPQRLVPPAPARPTPAPLPKQQPVPPEKVAPSVSPPLAPPQRAKPPSPAPPAPMPQPKPQPGPPREVQPEKPQPAKEKEKQEKKPEEKPDEKDKGKQKEKDNQ